MKKLEIDFENVASVITQNGRAIIDDKLDDFIINTTYALREGSYNNGQKLKYVANSSGYSVKRGVNFETKEIEHNDDSYFCLVDCENKVIKISKWDFMRCHNVDESEIIVSQFE